MQMFSNWERYTKHGINVASAATSAGFSAAKRGTSFGVCHRSIYSESRL